MTLLRRVRDSAVYRTRTALARNSARLQKLEARARFGPQVDSMQHVLVDPDARQNDAIVITTFQKRQLDYCLPLVSGLRVSGCQSPIVVIINGEAGNTIDARSRRSFLRALSEFDDVHPVALRGMVGLARMWNLGIQVGDAASTTILNDDLIIDVSTAASQLTRLASAAATDGLAVANGSWSMFAVSRQVIRDVGWFDERLLGFGEEDGDYSWRYRQQYGHYPKGLSLPALIDIKEPTRQDVAAGSSKYSLVNRVFTRIKFDGLSDDMLIEAEPPPSSRLRTPDFYPGETFRQAHAGLLGEADPEIVRSEIMQDPLA